jgi:UDP-N-acetylglucosamine 2-epimerase (non-hydrolysing)
VDDPAKMRLIAAALSEIAEDRPVIFPMHPRTAQRMREEAVSFGAVRILAPLRYMEMLDLVDGAFAVITDSGGLQEETTALGVPCFTVRDNTERPITITEGTNRLVPDPRDLPALVRQAKRLLTPRRPDGWDGHAAERIIEALRARLLV